MPMIKSNDGAGCQHHLPAARCRTLPPSSRRKRRCAIQERLTAMGLLDPPADGVVGAVTRWALRMAGIKGELTAENANEILQELSTKTALPLNPRDDLAGRIVRAAKEHDFWIARHKDCCNIFYIEGMDEDGTANANRPNEFNDLRVVIQLTAAGVPKITGMWQATTEPGRYWTLAADEFQRRRADRVRAMEVLEHRHSQRESRSAGADRAGDGMARQEQGLLARR